MLLILNVSRHFQKDLFHIGSYGKGRVVNLLAVHEALTTCLSEIEDEIVETRGHFTLILNLDNFLKESLTSKRNPKWNYEYKRHW